MNQEHTLAQILAPTDALWRPFRFRGAHDSPAAAAIAERRADFPRRGVPLVVRGGGTERLAGERELLDLESRRLVRIHRRGKRIGASLTGEGDDLARAVTATWTLRGAWPTLELVAEVLAAFGGRSNAGFVREDDVLGRPYPELLAGCELTAFEDSALPLLCRGLLVAASDSHGRVGYGVTPAGRRAMAKGPPPERELPDPDLPVGLEYDELHDEALADRDTWRATDTSLVYVPLSCGTWPAPPAGVADG